MIVLVLVFLIKIGFEILHIYFGDAGGSMGGGVMGAVASGILACVCREMATYLAVWQMLGPGFANKVLITAALDFGLNAISLAVLPRFFHFECRQTFVYSYLVVNTIGFFLWNYLVGQHVFGKVEGGYESYVQAVVRALLMIFSKFLELMANTAAYVLTNYFVSAMMFIFIRNAGSPVSTGITVSFVLMEIVFYEIVQRYFAGGIRKVASEGGFVNYSMTFDLPLKISRLLQAVQYDPRLFWPTLLLSVSAGKLIPRLSVVYRFNRDRKKVAAMVEAEKEKDLVDVDTNPDSAPQAILDIGIEPPNESEKTAGSEKEEQDRKAYEQETKTLYMLEYMKRDQCFCDYLALFVSCGMVLLHPKIFLPCESCGFEFVQYLFGGGQGNETSNLGKYNAIYSVPVWLLLVLVSGVTMVLTVVVEFYLLRWEVGKGFCLIPPFTRKPLSLIVIAFAVGQQVCWILAGASGLFAFGILE
ncbi:hypothetical protein HDU97_007960 [Phlyctochytrium planicorne]|nr:hypothetical protein HDU97_007960 [Phlyctochytrium planicorne]